MEQATSWLPGHLPLAAGKSVGIEPRTCGELRAGAGRLQIGAQAVVPGERIRLWRGDRVELTNAGDKTALFTWDACAVQPSRLERVRRWGHRIARALARRRAQLASCQDNVSCFRP
jgi:hypothetical protein